LLIHKTQIDALTRVGVDEFVERMVAHLERVFPEESAARGKAELSAMIYEGITRAASWRIEREYHICLYLDVMMALGPRFDEDPTIPWARELLEDPALGPGAGIDILHSRVFDPPVVPTAENEKP
jgi:hypothetical protein